MRVLAVLALVVVFLTLQTTLLAPLAPFCPDFAVALTIYIAFKQKVRGGVALVFLLGYVLDLFLRKPAGLHSLCLIALYLAVRPMHDKIRMEGFWPLAVLGFFGALFSSFLGALLSRIFLASFSLGGAYLGSLVFTAIATAVCTPPFVWLVQRITRGNLANAEEDLWLR